ncbi:MAG TPA: TetR/AcrR family transcriptional regulator [Castellaniella sp.]|uniref:TetR/AcrR family transcriptional regulator n=1 Tax=Castellaniella sp. TaxID=1955812 RepID=UPI002EF642AF
MSQKLTAAMVEARRVRILDAARWCFLNFGFSRTSLEEVARRASISRTSLYQVCRDKEDLFIQVFDDWLLSRLPVAHEAALATAAPRSRLYDICQIVLLDLWSEMEVAPMATEFHDVCERLRPQVAERQREGVRQCVAQVLGDPVVSLVFLLALEGLLTDRPSLDVLSVRVKILVDRFAGTA